MPHQLVDSIQMKSHDLVLSFKEYNLRIELKDKYLYIAIGTKCLTWYLYLGWGSGTA